jgi:gliding motility-associated-like protein
MANRLLLFFLVFFCVCRAYCFAQSPAWQWAKSAHSPGNEIAFDLATDPTSGNEYVGGSWDTDLSAVFGNTFTSTAGGTDGFVAKYDAAGNVIWAFSIGGTLNDAVLTVYPDPAGNVYVGGYYAGTANFNPSGTPFHLTSSGGNDGFLAKYTSGGTFLWAVSYGGALADDAPLNIFADANGAYIAGACGQSATFHSTNATTNTINPLQAGNNMFGAKYSPTGVIQWVVMGESNGADQGYDVVADQNSVYFIGDYGSAFSLYDKTGTLGMTMPSQNAGSVAAFIVSYSQSGLFNWATNASSVGTSVCRGIAQDAGNLYITGGFSNTEKFPFPTPLFTKTAIGYQDLYIAQLAKGTGVYQWVKSIPSTPGGITLGRADYLDVHGNLVIGGYFTNGMNFTAAGGSVINSSGAANVFVTSYSTSGVYQWVTQGGGTGTDQPYGLACDNSGGIYTAGLYDDTPSYGVYALPSDTLNNVFIAKLGCAPLSGDTISASQSICTGSTPGPLSGSIPAGGSGTLTYLWEQSPDNATWTIAPGTNNLQNYSPASIIASTYYRRIVSSAGTCTSTSLSNSVLITISPLPSAANAGADLSVCSASTSFAATVPTAGTGSWTLYSGAGIPGGTAANAPVTGLGLGQNKFIWTVTSGTCPVSKDTMMITVFTPPSAPFAGNDTSLCLSTSSFFTASPPINGTGSWSLLSGSGIPGSNAYNASVTGLGNGANTFIWVVSNSNCPVKRDTVVITVSQPPSPANAGSDITVCSTTSFFAATAPSPGTGAWTLLSGSGVPGSPAHNASVTGLGVGLNKFIWTVSNGSCPVSRDTMAFIVSAPPSAAHAGVDQSLCATTSSVFNATPPVTGTGAWTLLSGSGVPGGIAYNAPVTGLGSGSNTFIWTVTNSSCPASRDTVVINVGQPPSSANAGPDITVCSTTSFFAATAPSHGTGAWSLLSGSGVAGSSAPNAPVNGLGVGQDKFIWTVSSGACPVSRDTMLFIVSAPIAAAHAGNDQSLCATTSSVFNATPPVTGTGSWTLLSGSGVPGGIAYNAPVTGLGSGINTFIWTVTNGTCPSSHDTVVITVSQPPSIANAGADGILCSTTSSFAAVSPTIGTGSWTLLSGAGIPGSSAPNATVTGLGVGQNKFIWTVTNGSCPSSKDTMQFTVYAPPSVANAGNDTSLCSSSAFFHAAPVTVGIGTWSLLSGSGTPQGNACNAAITGLGFGSDCFLWTVSSGTCAASIDTVTFHVLTLPVAAAGSDQTIPVTTTTLTATPPASGTGTWSVVSGNAVFANVNDPLTTITGLPPGITILMWTVSNGACLDSSDEVIITVLLAEMPNGFSPNGDGQNDYFIVPGLDQLGTSKLMVFNRWGNEVFHSDNYQNDWDGKNMNGEDLTEDTYYYIIEPTTGKTIKGFIVLKRT